MGIYTFFFLNFIVSFLSDIVLSDLSTDKGQNIFKSDIIKYTSIKFNTFNTKLMKSHISLRKFDKNV